MMSSLTSFFAMQAASAAPAAAEAGVKVPTPDAYEHTGTYWMPEQASSMAHDVDWLYYAVLALNVVCFVAITIIVVYFCWKYRARPGHKAEPSASHNDALEITWTIIPSIIVVIIFVIGWKGYINMATPPKKALEIKVVGQKWDWFFKYKTAGGQEYTDSELHVPINQPVRLLMTSTDVLHSFFVPAFRVKQDVVPARYTHLWFKAIKPGTYRMYCAEYCGQGHSQMKTKAVVHPPGGYEKWLEEKELELMNMPPEQLGEKTYKLCAQCHSIDGSKGNGPSFKGLFGKTETLADGSTAVVDENYIRESIEDPNAKIVSGYQPIMPTFKGQLRQQQIDGLIAYIKTLK